MIGDGLRYLESLGGYETSGKLANPTIDTTAALMAELGHPERDYPVIHVTGTNGKGSTTAMIAGLLSNRGLHVGTYTSPHVNQLGERITIDGRPTTTERLSAALEAVHTAAERRGIAPSWFEAITAAALRELAEQKVDIAVVEVGMLGRWDATNTMVPKRVTITLPNSINVKVLGRPIQHVWRRTYLRHRSVQDQNLGRRQRLEHRPGRHRHHRQRGQVHRAGIVG
jgi:dihydrofolate synthase/folylpolyglutamate synthase